MSISESESYLSKFGVIKILKQHHFKKGSVYITKLLGDNFYGVISVSQSEELEVFTFYLGHSKETQQLVRKSINSKYKELCRQFYSK